MSNAERGFGAVRRGTQRVEAENGNAAAGTDLLGTLFAGRERFADEEVEDVHEERGSMGDMRVVAVCFALPLCLRCDPR